MWTGVYIGLAIIEFVGSWKSQEYLENIPKTKDSIKNPPAKSLKTYPGLKVIQSVVLTPKGFLAPFS